jgi:hypothetical protein
LGYYLAESCCCRTDSLYPEDAAARNLSLPLPEFFYGGCFSWSTEHPWHVEVTSSAERGRAGRERIKNETLGEPRQASPWRGSHVRPGPARDAHQTPHELHVCLEPRPARMHTPHRETVWCGWAARPEPTRLNLFSSTQEKNDAWRRSRSCEPRSAIQGTAGLGIFPPCEARLFVTWLATLWKRLRQPGCTFPLFRSSQVSESERVATFSCFIDPSMDRHGALSLMEVAKRM